MNFKDLLPIIKSNNIESIKEDFPDSEVMSVDDIGYTLLMYATAVNAKDSVTFLLEKNANPFQSDKFGNSAFSIAIREDNISLAIAFLKTKESELLSKYPEISEYISTDVDKTDFYKYIAINTENNLSKILGLNSDAAQICAAEAIDECKVLGVEVTSLTSDID